MLLDAQEYGSSEIVTDVCVIGAGAAGITIAREFAGSSYDVVLLESGGLRRDENVQGLYAGHSIGIPYAPLDECRSRYLGGSTNCWLGWCRPLDAIDFEPRPWMLSDGWPIERRMLLDHYRRAHELLMLGPFDYARDSWEVRLGTRAGFLHYDQEFIEDAVNQISPPTRFGKQFRAQLRRAPNIRTLLHATVTELIAHADTDAVESVAVSLRNGERMLVFARYVVLATGGIENARLLLLSDGKYKRGMGNAHDLVGRHFTDHPRIRHVRGRLTAPCARALYDHSLALVRQRLRIARGPITLHFSPTEQCQRERQLPNSRTYLVATSFAALPAFRASVRRLGVFMTGGARRQPSWQDFAVAAANFPAALRAAYDFIAPQRSTDSEFDLETVFEPIANPASRVRLVADRDRLGLRRVSVDWRLTEIDESNYVRSIKAVVEQLVQQRIIELVENGSRQDTSWPERIQWCWHHMGTTRMHPLPTRGVVDADCRVHGMDNLFVAGSSVFPTPGSDTPTLTVVAVALRLAQHLKRLLGAGADHRTNKERQLEDPSPLAALR